MSADVRTRGATGRGAHSGYEGLARGLGWFSIGLGLAELVIPDRFCRTLGLEGQEVLVRAYGAREIMAGVAILASHDPTPWIWARVGGDAVDLVTLAAGFRTDSPKGDNLALATAAVVGVTVLDVVCASGLMADKRLPPPNAFDYRSRTGFPKSPVAMRGVAADFAVPPDFRIPDLLRPWVDGRPTEASR